MKTPDIPAEAPSAESDAPLVMWDGGAVALTRNGRPVHDQNPPELGGTHPCWQTTYAVQLHHEHANSICRECGCCWGCEDDCCAGYEVSCPNPDCGCSREAQLGNQRFDDEQRARVLPPAEGDQS